MVFLLLQSELKKITMGDKDTLICKVGKMCHLNSKATMKEERSSSQNCHSIRPFTPLIFMCWENKISTERFTSFFSWVLQGWPEVYKRLYVSSYIGFEPIGIVGGGTRIWACQFKLAHTAQWANFFPRFVRFVGGLTKKYGDKVAWWMGVSRDLYLDTKASPVTMKNIIQLLLHIPI